MKLNFKVWRTVAMTAKVVQGSFVFYKGQIQVPRFVRPERAQTIVLRGCQNVTQMLHSIVAHELQILKQVGAHANIAWLVDVIPTNPNPPTLVFDNACLMPSLAGAPKEERVRQAHFLLLQIGSALAHLASVNIVHTNVHPSAIQIAASNTRHGVWWFRLTGFGNAVPAGAVVANDQRWTLPPECNHASQFTATHAIDMWQLGMTLRQHMQNEAAPSASPLGKRIKDMILPDPKSRPSPAELQEDTFHRALVTYLLGPRTGGSSVAQDLAEAIESSVTNLSTCSSAISAYAHPGPLCSLAEADVKQMLPEYTLITLEQLASAASALQVFITTHRPGGSSVVTDAAAEDAGELWHILSLLRTICLESNVCARQNISVFVLWELQPDIFALRKELDCTIVTSELVWSARNVDHLLDYFYRCACAWDHDSRPMLSRHPQAHVLEAARQRLNAALQHRGGVEDWALSARNDCELIIRRFSTERQA